MFSYRNQEPRADRWPALQNLISKRRTRLAALILGLTLALGLGMVLTARRGARVTTIRYTYTGRVSSLSIEMSCPYKVTMEVRSRGSEATDLLAEDLPWHRRIFLMGLGENGGRVQECYVIDDSIGPHRVHFGPGTALRGEVSLAWFFTRLDDWVHRGDVLLPWRYTLRDSSGKVIDVYEATFVIPRMWKGSC